MNIPAFQPQSYEALSEPHKQPNVCYTLLCCGLVIHEIYRQQRLCSTDMEIYLILYRSQAELVLQDCSRSVLNLCPSLFIDTALN